MSAKPNHAEAKKLWGVSPPKTPNKKQHIDCNASTLSANHQNETYLFLLSQHATNMTLLSHKETYIAPGIEMSKLLDQLKKRRKDLQLTQDEMMLRVGMSRQQYQRLESRGNPTLENLELIAKGLKLELMLIPLEKLQAVKAVLESKQIAEERTTRNDSSDENPLASDPWKNLLANDS